MKKKTTFTSAKPNPDLGSVLDISAEEVAQKLDQALLIDVREPSEFTGELGHVPGSRLLVLGTLPDQIDSLPKNETIVFICKSGGRSARAAAFAQSAGFTDVFNMKGGMMHWNALRLQTEGATSDS